MLKEKKKKPLLKPTFKQRKAFQLLMENPNMTKKQALIQAGYSPSVATVHARDIINSDGFKTLQKEYHYHLDKMGVDVKLIAEKMRAGIEGEDKKASVLEYLKETKRDLGLSKDVPDTMIQINISGELQEYAK